MSQCVYAYARKSSMYASKARGVVSVFMSCVSVFVFHVCVCVVCVYYTPGTMYHDCAFTQARADVLCWLDCEGGLSAGTDHVKHMTDGVNKAHVVVIFLSDAYIKSENCRYACRMCAGVV